MFSFPPLSELMLIEASDIKKLAALKYMRDEIINGEPIHFFDIAKKFVADKNHDVRWQALIVLGEYIPSQTRNDEIWDVIVRFCDADDDMRNALATILLEHDYDSTCQKLQFVIPEKINSIRDLTNRCWSFSTYKLPEVFQQSIRYQEF